MLLSEINQNNIKFIAIAQSYGITVAQIGSRESNADKTKCINATREILRAAGLTEPMIRSLVSKESRWNWLSLYEFIMVQYAIELAERVSTGNEQCEVGLKCPEFRRYNLFKRYNLSYSGEFEPEYSRDLLKDRKMIYKVYQNPDKTISFSDGGQYWYSGLTFSTLQDAYEFAVWFTTRKSFDCKDIDVFFNGLGALGLEAIKEFNETCNLPKPLSV